MNKELIKRLKGYSTMAIGILIADKAESQVIYTDIDPDTVFAFNYIFFGEQTRVFPVDLNDDGINDFAFSVHTLDYNFGSSGYGSYEIKLNNYSGNAVRNNIPYSPEFGVEAATFGDGIKPADNWNNAPSIILAAAESSSYYQSGSHVWNSYRLGYWQEQSDKFLGLKFNISGETHYGWLRLTVDAGWPGAGHLYLKDFAYEATPNFPIHAGDIGGCFPPVPIGTVAISSTTAKAKWETVGSAEHYELQYRPLGAILWTTKMIDAPKTFRKINSLTCAANYEWHVRAVCDDGTITDYSPIQIFTTAVCRMENENVIDEENIDIYTYSNKLFVNIDEDIAEAVSIVVYDNLGRKVFEHQITDQQNIFELNVASGIYLVTVNSGEKQFIKKINIHSSGF